MLDVGAGAGFPGVVLKIVWPDLRLTLLEATAKKTAFLAALVEALGLEDVEVVTGRAEDAGARPALARPLRPGASRGPWRRCGACWSWRCRSRASAAASSSPKGSRAAAELAAAGGALDAGRRRRSGMPFDVPGPPQTLVVVREAARDAVRATRGGRGVPAQVTACERNVAAQKCALGY